MAENQINSAANADQRMAWLTAQEFGAKFQSKREIYRFLSTEVGIYLPTYETGKLHVHFILICVFSSQHFPSQGSVLKEENQDQE